MSEVYEKVTGDQNPLKRLIAKIPGFDGYVEQSNRKAADKLLRELIASKYTEQWKRVGELQQDFASSGELTYLDDLEKAAMKLQTFIDKISNAAYGYSSFFDAVKIKEDELARLYEFDVALLDMVDEVSRAVDNVQSSVGTDGLPAAVSHLVGLTRDIVTTYERRDEVILTIE